MAVYRIIEIIDPRSGGVFHVAREKSKGSGRYVYNNLLSEARRGTSGPRYDIAREILDVGQLPEFRRSSDDLDRESASALVDALRAKHGIVLGRRSSPYKRVHQQTDPNSPDLDPAPIYYVYELIRPDTNKVFYVGKGSDRHRPRIDGHVYLAKRGKKGHKFAVIRKLLKMGLKPVERRIAENLTESEALKLEVEHISSIGLNVLTNDATGGQTAPTGDDHWTRKHPEKVLRGDDHPLRKDPSRAATGKRNGAYTKPNRRPRGAKHGMAKLGRAQIDKIRKLYQEGIESGNRVTGKQLASDFGVTSTQISRVLRGESWGLPNLIKKHGNAKLTAEQIESIPSLIADGKTQKAIAQEFGVSHSLINYYAKKIEVELVVT